MWVFKKEVISKASSSDGMPLEELKLKLSRELESCRDSCTHSRVGEVKLNTWEDGIWNLWFLVTKMEISGKLVITVTGAICFSLAYVKPFPKCLTLLEDTSSPNSLTNSIITA